jgi:hypothetical protein
MLPSSSNAHRGDLDRVRDQLSQRGARPTAAPLCRLSGTDHAPAIGWSMTMITLLIVLLVLALLGSVPAWPYSRGWGYYPSGGLGLILLILIVLALSGRL